MSDVTDALDRLIAGEVDLDQVADEFRARPWPQTTRVETHDATDLYALDTADPVDAPEGAFSEVAGYLARHLIDPEQYRVLSDAAARAMQDAPMPGTPAGAVNERTSA